MLYDIGKLSDCLLHRITQIDWLCIIGSHQCDQSIDQIGDILERSCLLAIAIDRDGFVPQCLQYEIGDNTPIVHMHSRSVGVEDTCHTHLHLFLKQEINMISKLSIKYLIRNGNTFARFVM